MRVGGFRRAGRNTGSTVFSLVMLSLVVYLTIAVFQGEYGLFRLFEINAEEGHLEKQLAELRIERERVANKTRRLSTETLDLELLDERARVVLGLGRENEIIIR